MSALLQATMAVATGQARHVLVFRTVTEASARTQASDEDTPVRVDGPIQWRSPFNAPSAANWVALAASRYMHEFGLTREQLSAIALNGRSNAMRTPGAVYRTPLSFDDYMGSRQISSPLCLYDCDVPMDGSVALLVSHRGAVSEASTPPLWIEAICGPFVGPDTWDQQPDITRFRGAEAGRRLWSRTDFRPSDVDVAQVYDGFSFLALLWLEDLGFCPRGEAGRFIEGGRRIALDGELPLNTSGGQLSFGRLHGLGLVHEACVQLRGLGGERQVAGTPRLAVATNGGGPVASAVLLSRD
jgi:acetyl-CoA acetyltransferase